MEQKCQNICHDKLVYSHKQSQKIKIFISSFLSISQPNSHKYLLPDLSIGFENLIRFLNLRLLLKLSNSFYPHVVTFVIALILSPQSKHSNYHFFF